MNQIPLFDFEDFEDFEGGWAEEETQPQIQMRDYQDECIESVLQALTQGVNRQVVSLATGGGKTLIFSALVSALPEIRPGANKVLVLAHRKELVYQNAEKLKWLNPDASVGIEMAELRSSPEDDIISASVQTVGNSRTSRIERFDPSEFKAVIVDEVHHCSENNTTYQRTLKHFGFLEPDCPLTLLGFSATVKRSDGRGLEHAYDEITYHKGIKDGIEEQWLAPLRALRVGTETDISNVSRQGAEFVADELESVINTDPRNDEIYRAWYNHAYSTGRKATLIFCANVRHVEAVTETFRANQVDARCIYNGTPPELRKQNNEDFLNGRFPVYVNCAVLTEGTDFPLIDTLIMARPCRSSSLYIQSVGRGLRLPTGYNSMVEVEEAIKKGENVSKRDCLVLDIVDVCGSHSLITTPVLFNLNHDFDAQGDEIAGTAKRVQQLAVQNPSALSGKNIADCERIVAEEIDLLALRDPDDHYARMTDMMWRQQGDKEVFRAEIPGQESKSSGFLRVEQDAVGQWEVKFCDPTGVEDIVRKRNTVELAFQSADAWIKNNYEDRLPLMLKNQKWHSKAASDKQKDFLKKLKVPYENNLTQINASKMINDALLARRKGRGRKVKKGNIENVTVGRIGNG